MLFSSALKLRSVDFGLGVQSRGEVDWIAPEAIGFVCPSLADCLVGSEAAQGLEPFGEVIGIEEGGEVLFELAVAGIVISPDGGLLEGSVHPLDLAVGPRVIGLG